MAEVRGVDVIIRVAATASPSALGELDLFSSLGIQISNSAEDNTTKGSNQVRSLSTATAMKSYSIDGSFVADDTALEVIEAAVNSGDPKIYAELTCGSRTYTGLWLVESFSQSGDTSGPANGTISLQNADATVVATV